MLTTQQIREVESAENDYRERIHQAVQQRYSSDEGWERWRQACADWHAHRPATDFLWDDSTREKVLSGDQEAIEDSILFLEVDPWFFRSGYLKERLIGGLKQAELSLRQRKRLQQLILKVCGGRGRREFRSYCALAAKLWTREFEYGVRAAAAAAGSQDSPSNRKFSWLLQYLEQNQRERGHFSSAP